MCPYHFVAQCAVWVLEFEGPKNVNSVITHVLGVAEFESLSKLGDCYFVVFPEVIGEFLVYLIVG
jgi:hypothetical protein